ncbi:zinc finger protein 62 homolog [Ostrinia furnacalis]|uniref:zinc finger protein 62 homolog n=1 Tax=Ostrinia furnacalis TaxID=93504 RepID=UPI00103E454B|nr:zinc finger protein 62 homolog [Ostrinia furnacalis]
MIPFKWRGKYICFYCGEHINDYSDLRQHTIDHGDCTDNDRAIKLVKAGDAEVKIDVSDITCKLCLVSFMYFDDMLTHLMLDHHLPYNKDVPLALTTYRLVDLKCVFCDSSFNYFNKLVSHVNLKHPVNQLYCHDCNQKFNKKRDLESHIRARHRSEYVCMKCPVTFDSNAALQKHKATSHASLCNVCFEPFSSDTGRANHIKKVHFDNDILQCGFCLKILSTKIAFLNHASKCNVKDSKDYIETVDDDKKPTVVQIRNNIACIINMSTALPFKYFMNKFRCFYCAKDFTECDDLKEHTVVEHPICNSKLKCMRLRNREAGAKVKLDVSTLSCKMCFEPMKDLDYLIDHLVVEHKAQYDKAVDHNVQPFKLIKDDFPCPFCAESYRYFSSLLKHISENHTENNVICPFCGVTFRADHNLRFHISFKHKTGNFKCTVCDLSFPTKAHLRDHSGSVHGDKVAQCQECLEKFTTLYAVQRHRINVHGLGHKCSYCGKLFTKKSFMVNHVRRLHLKEKNVECSVCFERFFDANALKMHTIKHVGERNFHCDICGKKFLWKKNLIGHMSSHIKTNPV